MNTDFFPEYGYGKYKDVISGIQFERLASASGPTLGEIRRPSDGQIPKKIVFVACAGSRDPAKGIPYCSKICCMYTAKHAMLYQHKVHEGESYVFYMDIRAGGKNYEEFVRRAIEEDGVNYVRGRVSRIYEKNGKLIVKGVDTLLGASPVEIEADMVVLATAGVANKGAEELAQKLHVSYDPYKFFAEADSLHIPYKVQVVHRQLCHLVLQMLRLLLPLQLFPRIHVPTHSGRNDMHLHSHVEHLIHRFRYILL